LGSDPTGAGGHTGEPELSDGVNPPQGLTWQIGVWDRMSQLYVRDIDERFAPVVEGVIRRASLQAGERVLDLGTGTGAAARRAATLVGPAGKVIGVDISRDMLAVAERAAAALNLNNIEFSEGGAERIPAGDATADVMLASLSLMYVIDRAAAAREIARVVRPGGRLVAAVWAGAPSCDIVLFQQTAAAFAPPPPVSGVGPGALADPAPFLAQLAAAGIVAGIQTEIVGFDFPDFDSAWQVLAGVTASTLAPERCEEAKAAVRTLMWPRGDGPRHFSNATQFIVGARTA
jgi:SAM-dependent methyltransferase